MTKRFSTKRLVLSALFAALACVAIMSVRIPTPDTGGYIHPGDVIVIPCGVFLDPVSAFLTAGIDSCMADLLGGYSIYVPIIFAIKGLAAFSANHVCRSLGARRINPCTAVTDCGVINIILVTGGCCTCEVFLYGLGAILASIPSNITQGISGLIISSALCPVLQKPLPMALKV